MSLTISEEAKQRLAPFLTEANRSEEHTSGLQSLE